MTEATEAGLWEYRETGLIIIPGLDWDEWLGVWSAVDRMHRSVNWWVGDALNYSQAAFPDTWTQVVDEKYIEQQRGPMWVCSKIPLARRREGLSYSLHKVIAGLPTVEEQDHWLDRAEPERWSVKRLQEEMAAARAARAGSNGGPALAEPEPTPEATGEPPDATEAGPDATEACSTWNGKPVAEGNLERLYSYEKSPGQDQPAERRKPDVADLRACIVAIRAIAPKLALNLPDPDIHTLPAKIAAALGVAELAPNPLFDVLAAVETIPDEWRPSIRMEAGEKVFGGRKWTVEVRRAGGLAIGAGPWLPAALLECALAATISDLMSP